jgi:hypothetical protein
MSTRVERTKPAPSWREVTRGALTTHNDYFERSWRTLTGNAEMDSIDSKMVQALFTEAYFGPNDELLNEHGRKTYWISTLRYRNTGWQTAVFDRDRLWGAWRPIFRINELEDPLRALLNHLTAIVAVAESLQESWPMGMKWKEPSEASWSEARTKVLIELSRVDSSLEGVLDCHSALRNQRPLSSLAPFIVEVIDYYSTVRNRYHCVHLKR